MFNSFSNVTLVGNMTDDIQVKQSGETTIGTFSVAINDRKKEGSEYVNDPSFIDIVAFNKSVGLIEKFAPKGSSILVNGRLKQDRWETPEGQKRSKIKVIVNSVTFLNSKGEPTGSPTPVGAGVSTGADEDNLIDMIP